MKTYNVKLKFTNDQDKQSLIDSLLLKQQAFNVISAIRFQMTTCNGIKPLHHRSYALVRAQFPTLPSQFVICAQRDVIAKYKAIRSNKHKIDSPVISNKLNIQLDKRIYRWVSNDTIAITTKNARVTATLLNYPQVNALFAAYAVKDPSLFVRDGVVYIRLVFDNSTTYQGGDQCLGVDLGLKRLASLSNGLVIKGQEFNKHKRKIRWNKRKLQGKKSHSARTKLHKLRRKEANFSKNYIHHVTNIILKTEASTIVLEDLTRIKSKSKGRRFNNKNSQMPYFEVRRILSYKASALGKRVVLVKPHYTSQLDHRGLENGKRKGCRYYALDGVVLDADLNAANNITLRWDNKHSITCSALDGQATVNKPIVCCSQQASSYPLR